MKLAQILKALTRAYSLHKKFIMIVDVNSKYKLLQTFTTVENEENKKWGTEFSLLPDNM